MKEREHLGMLFGALAAFTYALLGVSVRYCSSLPTATIVFFRFIIGFAFLLPWLIRSSAKFSFRKVPKHLSRALAGIASLSCLFYTIQHMPLVNAITFANSAPLFLPLIYLVWKKLLIPKRRVLAQLIGFLGVLVILRPSPDLGEFANLIGLLGALLAASIYAILRDLTRTEETHSILLYYFLLSSLVTAIPAVLNRASVDWNFLWLPLLAVGVFGALFQYFLTKSYEHAPATKASIMTYLGVVFSGFFAWILFDEVPTFFDLCGGILVIAGGLIALFDKNTPRVWGEKN